MDLIKQAISNFSDKIITFLPENFLDYDFLGTRKNFSGMVVLCFAGGFSAWYIFYRKSRNPKLSLKKMNIFNDNTYITKVIKVRLTELIHD